MSKQCTAEGCGRQLQAKGLCLMHYKRIWRRAASRPPKPLLRRYASVQSRFMDKIRICGNSECWTWLGRKDADGYGRFIFGGRHARSHRVMWMLEHGEPIPAGMFVCHSCDNPSCVNPAHLWLGTNQDNINDAIAKGRFTGRPRKQQTA